jgi:hypothetical protein
MHKNILPYLPLFYRIKSITFSLLFSPNPFMDYLVEFQKVYDVKNIKFWWRETTSAICWHIFALSWSLFTFIPRKFLWVIQCMNIWGARNRKRILNEHNPITLTISLSYVHRTVIVTIVILSTAVREKLKIYCR